MNPLALARQTATFVGELLAKRTPFFGLLPPEWEQNPKDLFFYTAEWLPILAGASVTVATQTNRDSGFLMIGAVIEVTDTAAPPAVVTDFPGLVLIKDSTSGRDLMDRPVAVRNLAGTAQLPAIWPWPKWIPPGSTISTTLTSNATASRSVRLSYLGFKVFARQGQG